MSCGNAGPWKAWKAKSRLPTLSTVLGKPQKQRASHIPTASTTGPYIKERLSKAGLTAGPKTVTSEGGPKQTAEVGQNHLPNATVAVTVNEVQKALRECSDWITYHPRFGYRLEIPKSEDLIRSGWHHWQRHTREGFEKALDCFENAIHIGLLFRGYEGISRCYLMLGTFALRHPRETYAAFAESHEQAVAVNGLTPELRSDAGQALHVFHRQFTEAESELRKAQEGNPRHAETFIRLTALYACLRRFDDAFAALRHACDLDALLPIVSACETMLHCMTGNLDKAVTSGKKAVDLHPYFAPGRSRYAQALEQSGRFEEALAEFTKARMITPDMPELRAQEAYCLALMGRRREAQRILAELRRRGRTEFVDGYVLAPVYGALGETGEALLCLENSLDAGSPHLSFIDVDYRMNSLRRMPRFIEIRNQVFRDIRPRRMSVQRHVPNLSGRVRSEMRPNPE